MSKVLVQYNGNWADEMDLYGFRIMDKTIWENHMARALRFLAFNDFEKCVGTNEEVTHTKSSYERSFTATDISETEEAMIKRLFPKWEYNGQFAAIGRGEMFEHPEPEDENYDLEY